MLYYVNSRDGISSAIGKHLITWMYKIFCTNKTAVVLIYNLYDKSMSICELAAKKQLTTVNKPTSCVLDDFPTITSDLT